MMEKLEDSGDPAYLCRRNAELLSELTASKREAAKMKKDIEDLQRKVKDLSRALTFDVERADKASSPLEAAQREEVRAKSTSRKRDDRSKGASDLIPLDHTGPGKVKRSVFASKAGSDFPELIPTTQDVVMRPPIQGISSPIPAVERSTLRSERDLDADLTKQLLEPNTQKRQLRQAIKNRQSMQDKDGAVATISKPRVMSDIQIAPPIRAAGRPTDTAAAVSMVAA